MNNNPKYMCVQCHRQAWIMCEVRSPLEDGPRIRYPWCKSHWIERGKNFVYTEYVEKFDWKLIHRILH